MPEFRMPALGADMTEGTLLEWLVHPGDTVHRGDIVAVVDTDKAAIEVECFADGVVAELLVQPGTKVAVGTPLATIGGSAPPAAAAGPVLLPERAAPVPPVLLPERAAPVPPVQSPIVRHLAHEQGVDLATIRGSGPDGVITRADVTAATTVPAPPPRKPATAPPRSSDHRGKASPYARRRATDLGVDLGDVAGSGPGGAITSADVEALGAQAAGHVEAMRPAVAAATSEAAARAPAMRRAIGELMARSKREVPHYYVSTTVDMTAATDWLRATNVTRPVAQRLVPAALVLKACALAARKVPSLNGFWIDDALHPSESVHLGVAVSLRPAGLVAPAILDADLLDLDQMMAKLLDLVARARQGRLRAREMSEGTLTVTNLGDNGAEAVFGVIYPPQVALVGIGRVREMAVARNGLVGARPCVTVTLSADHRATDGHEGSRFLAAVAEFLQTPEKL